jgi:hypothetical protein
MVLAGFEPNHNYSVPFGGFRGGSSIAPVWRNITTDEAGAFSDTVNIAYIVGDQALVTIETVTSGLVSVRCQ